MISDVNVNADAVSLLVEQYGSLAHLAEAVGVTRLQLMAWCEGTEKCPLEKYREMVDAVAAARLRPR